MHLGRPWPQNAKGHLLGDVTDQGKARRPTRRRAATRSAAIAFPFHSDGSDLVGLFCLDAGASGGASLVANAVTIHNELVRTAPELAAELYAPFPYDLRGEQAPGSEALVHDADLQPAAATGCSCATSARTSRRSRRHDDAPRPSDAAREAMDRVDDPARRGVPAGPYFDDDGQERQIPDFRGARYVDFAGTASWDAAFAPELTACRRGRPATAPATSSCAGSATGTGG